MELIIGLAIGLIVGGAACWLVQTYRSRERLMQAESQHRETTAGLRGQLEQAASANAILEAAKEQLSETFQATASRALQSNNEVFVNLAKENLGKTLETAKGEFNQRHEQFQALVKPLTQNYEKLNPQIESLIKQSQTLAGETGKLSNALTNNRQIGSWGEVQLRRVVELAGMTEHCDFVEQSSVNGSGDRPDMTVLLPDNRAVVVDAKASTAAYLEAHQTEDEGARDAALTRHAGAMRSQVDSLAAKNYGNKVSGSLDFVVMFVPGDQFLSAALNAHPDLIDYAMQKRVAIATPVSLISLLWTVANGWDRYRIAENAEVIRQAGEEMHKRMQTFISRYQGVGKGLEAAVKSYNDSIGSFDSRVVPQGRRFAELVRGSEEEFTAPKGIDGVVRASNYAETASTGLPSGD